MAVDTKLDIWGIVRSNWWIVVLTVLVGAAVAVGASAGVKVAYTGKTYIDIDVAAVNVYAQLPRQDALIAMSTQQPFVEGVAQRLGVPAAQVAGAYKVYSTGNPQNQLWTSFTSPDRAMADKGAKAVAEELLATAVNGSKALKEMLSDSVKADEDALAALGTPKDAGEQYYLWSFRRTLYADRQTFKFVDGAFKFDAPVTVAATSRRAAAKSAAVGGALAGLFLGIVLVAIRVTLSRRRESTASA